MLLAFPFLPETVSTSLAHQLVYCEAEQKPSSQYAPTLLQYRARKLRKASRLGPDGQVFYVGVYHQGGKISLKNKLKVGLSRPFRESNPNRPA